MKKTGFLFIILAGLFWGTSCIFVHYLAPYGFSTFQMIGFRGGVSFLCLLLYMVLCRRDAFRVTLRHLALFVAGGLCLFGTCSAYYAAMQISSVSTAAVLLYTAPMFVMLCSVLFLGEPFHARKGIAVGCMLIGCALVSGIAGGLVFDGMGFFLGLLSGILYAGYSLLSKIEMAHDCDPLSASFYCFFTVTVAALFTAKPLAVPALVAQRPLYLLAMILALGICTFVIPYLLYNTALKTVPAGVASVLAITEPMAATLYSVILFSEQLSLPAICGILLILFAVVLLSRAEHPKRPVPICDLHTHSVFSDGTFSPEALITEAKHAGLAAIALTDHNTVGGLAALHAAAADTDIEVISGVEISTDYGEKELHIVGLFLPAERLPDVTERLEQLNQNKLRSSIALVERLNAAGYQVDLAALRAKTPGGVFNRAHVAEALLAGGYVSSIKEAFATLLAKSGEYYVPAKRLPALETITFLREIGAVPVLAHPFLDLSEAELRAFLPAAKEAGLAAMETRYVTYDDATTALARSIAKEFGLAESGGSDFHGSRKPDIALGCGKGSLVVPLSLAEQLRALATH